MTSRVTFAGKNIPTLNGNNEAAYYKNYSVLPTLSRRTSGDFSQLNKKKKQSILE
jgi:hypothetical protein